MYREGEKEEEEAGTSTDEEMHTECLATPWTDFLHPLNLHGINFLLAHPSSRRTFGKLCKCLPGTTVRMRIDLSI